MQIQASEIKVDRSDHRLLIVARKHLRMDKARRVFIDLDTSPQKLRIIAASQQVRI